MYERPTSAFSVRISPGLSKGAGVGDVGQAAGRAPPQPLSGLQAARALLLGPEGLALSKHEGFWSGGWPHGQLWPHGGWQAGVWRVEHAGPLARWF